jgi:hypothetical protein
VIALDTNVLRRYLDGMIARDTVIAARAVATDEAMLPPIVLTEALSDTAASDEHTRRTLSIALMPLFRGYWSRAGNHDNGFTRFIDAGLKLL